MFLFLILGLFLTFLSLLSPRKHVITRYYHQGGRTLVPGQHCWEGAVHNSECPEVIMALVQPVSLFVAFTPQHLQRALVTGQPQGLWTERTGQCSESGGLCTPVPPAAITPEPRAVGEAGCGRPLCRQSSVQPV